MTRQEAFELLNAMTFNKNLVRHGVAVEAIMRSLANVMKDKHPKLPDSEFNQEEWGLVGLLHDADYELVEKNPDKHTLITAEKLTEKGVSDRVINGIKAHHEGIKPKRENMMEKAVYCVDELSGLITAVALVRPDKKLSSVTVDSVMNKFPQKSFAAGAKRDQILRCEEELGIPLKEFVAISLAAMQSCSDDLGL